jgi:hypothetical protein
MEKKSVWLGGSEATDCELGTPEVAEIDVPALRSSDSKLAKFSFHVAAMLFYILKN